MELHKERSKQIRNHNLKINSYEIYNRQTD